MKDLWSTAAALYDGGWRANEREEIKEEYNFTADEMDDLDAICEYLQKWENEE